MNTVGQIERITQNRVVQLFEDKLGYDYLGDWQDRPNNSNIEEDFLRTYLKDKKGYSNVLIDKALYELDKAAKNLSDGLYAANKHRYL